MRLTFALALLALDLPAVPDDQRYPYAIGQRTGLPTGALAPKLRQMEHAGWLTSSWEDPHRPAPPTRRFYQLTDEGRRVFAQITRRVRDHPQYAYLTTRKYRQTRLQKSN